MIKFDHIIHYVKDLNEVKETSVLPIHTGGVHETLGTENLISYFDTRYVEYLSIKDKSTFESHLNSREPSFARKIDGKDEGFITYALVTTNIDTLNERYLAKGYDTYIQHMSRISNGEEIKWQLLYILNSDFPFFIQWEEDKETRLKRVKTLCGDLKSPSIKIVQTVPNLDEWLAFFDVIGVWEGEVDDYTRIHLSEGPYSIELQLSDGVEQTYKNAKYKI